LHSEALAFAFLAQQRNTSCAFLVLLMLQANA